MANRTIKHMAARWWSGVKAALPMGGFSGGAYGGGRSLFYGLLPGARVDYQRKAGQLWKNSIVAASINWIGRNLPSAPPCVYKKLPDGKEEIVPNHPLTQLLLRPNKYYGGRTLRIATMLSLIVNGNAYWYIVRDMRGRPKELWYLPHFQIAPWWRENATTDNWIEGYKYSQRGKTIDLKFEDVIHFRDGLDPENGRLGLAPLGSALREVCTDNESSGYAAAIMTNFGVPGAVISPKGDSKVFSDPTKNTLRDQWEENVGGDNRGKPLVLSGPIEVSRLSLSPEELLLDKAQDKPEQRICALIGIPAAVLQLGVGLEQSTYNNVQGYRKIAWEEGVIPRLDLINSEIDIQLLPYLGDPATERAGVDLRRVSALTESQDALYKRLTEAVGGPWLTANEARGQVGMTTIEGRDELYPPRAGGAQPEPNEPDDPADPADPAQDGKSPKGKAGDKADGKAKAAKSVDDTDPPLPSWAKRVLDEIEALAEEAAG